MSTVVVIVDEAEVQLRELVEWWTANRPAATELLEQEFATCVALLETAPEAGVRFTRTQVAGVRRLVMKRTRHLVYYVHDRPRAVVYVIAVWGAPREGDPPLRQP